MGLFRVTAIHVVFLTLDGINMSAELKLACGQD
jgi:hypothetical protein